MSMRSVALQLASCIERGTHFTLLEELAWLVELVVGCKNPLEIPVLAQHIRYQFARECDLFLSCGQSCVLLTALKSSRRELVASRDDARYY